MPDLDLHPGGGGGGEGGGGFSDRESGERKQPLNILR